MAGTTTTSGQTYLHTWNSFGTSFSSPAIFPMSFAKPCVFGCRNSARENERGMNNTQTISFEGANKVEATENRW